METLVKGRDYIIERGVLKIREGIKVIPKKSFESNKEINEVLFPSSLVYIGESAFRWCSNITDLIIPDSVKYISKYAFSGYNINRLILGTNVTFIGVGAFERNNLEAVINNSTKLRFIDTFAFASNENLSEFDVSNCVKTVFADDYAFQNTSEDIEFYDHFNLLSFNVYGEYDSDDTIFWNNICSSNTTGSYTYNNGVLKIKDGVEIIGDFRDFKDCKRVEMPDSVVIILANAFSGLTKLKDVRFSKNLLAIFQTAFYKCGLKEHGVMLPNSLGTIEFSSFLENSGNENIVLPDTTVFESDFRSDAFYYRVYSNNFDTTAEENRIDISKLLEEEKNKLDSLGLLPNTINENLALNCRINRSQANLLKTFMIDYITNTEYDERNNIQFLTDILKLKDTDISDVHEAINYLFNKKQIKTIYLLISHGYDYKNNSMISRAIINNLYEMIEILLLLGANINEIGTIETTPLSTACIQGNYNVVKSLIEKGAAIDMTDSKNKKAIDYAIENNHNDIVELINCYDRDITESESDLEEVRMHLKLGE